MIKTAIFDLGGVYFSDGTKRAIRVISNMYNLAVSDVENVIKGDAGTDYRRGQLTTEEFWNKAKQIWKINATSDELSDIWFGGYKPIEGMNDILAKLSAAGYELLYLSDNVQDRVNYLNKRFNFLPKFNDGIFSFAFNVRKPDIRIYQLALEKTSNTSSECVYIDDIEEFLEPALRLGMKAILFTNVQQLIKDLNGLGLVF